MVKNLQFCLLSHTYQKRRKKLQKQPSRGVIKERCSENNQQIYKKTPMPKCEFNNVSEQVTLWHGCSPVNLIHIFRTTFLKNTSGRLLLKLKKTF